MLHPTAAQVQSPDWAEAVCVKKFHQLLAVGRWFPPGTPLSSTRKLISSSHHHFTALQGWDLLQAIYYDYYYYYFEILILLLLLQLH